MMTAQDRVQIFLNSLSSGGGARVMRGLLLLIAAALLMLAFTGLRFRSFDSPLAMELAESARHTAAGRGAVTGVIRPFDRAWLAARGKAERDDGLLPLTRHAPLYPRLLAVILPADAGSEAMPPRDPAETRIVLLGGALTLLAVLFVFLGARALYGPGAAWVAGTAYLVSLPVLENAIGGHQATLLAMLTAAALWMLAVAFSRLSAGQPEGLTGLAVAAAGVLCGLAVATAYVMLAAAAMLALLTAVECRTSRRVGLPLFLAGLAVVLVPLLVTTHTRTGSLLGTAPLGIFTDTLLAPGTSLDSALVAEIRTTGALPSLRFKLLTGLQGLLAGGMWRSGGLLLAAFLVTLFVQVERPGVQSLKLCTLGGWILMLAAAALLGGTPAAGLGLAGMFPLLAVTAAGGMCALIDREEWFLPGWETIGRLVLLLLVALPAVVTVLTPARFPYPPYYPPLVAAAARLVPPDEPVASDMPWAVAWYGRRRAVLLPASVEALLELRAALPSLRTVHLTTLTGDRAYLSELRQGAHATWLPLLQGHYPEGFPFTNAVALPPGRLDQWILTDRHPGTVRP